MASKITKILREKRVTLPERIRQDLHPDVKRVDQTRLDSATRELYHEAELAAAEAEEENNSKPKQWRISSPFQLGFVATLGVLTALLLGGLISQVSTVLLYITGGLFIALGLDPIVRFLERKGLARGLSIAIVYLSLTAVLALVLSFIIPTLVEQINMLIVSAPSFFVDVSHQNWYLDISERFEGIIDFDEILRIGREFVNDPQNWQRVAGGVWQAGLGILNATTATMIVFILSLYFLASLRSLKRGFYQLTPKSKRARVIDITEQITDSVGGYVSGQAMIALANSLCGFIAMSIIGVPFAAVLAVVVFGLALIPLVGALSATVLVSLVALFDSPTKALIVLIYYLIYMQIEAYVLTPRIMNRVVSVPGAFVVIGALTGGTLLGPMGALIAIPVTASLLMIMKQVWYPLQDKR